MNNPLAYQPFDPKSVGSEVSFVFGPLSGGNHAKKIIEENGYICDDKEKALIAQNIKDMYSDRRKGITDLELVNAYVKLKYPINVTSIDYGKSQGKANLKLIGDFFGNTNYEVTDKGDNSALSTLLTAIQVKLPDIEITDYYSKSMKDAGINSKSQSTITIKCGKDCNAVEGVAIDQDIELSSLKALINATNKIFVEMNYRK